MGSHNSWDPIRLLEINNPFNLCFTCVGYAKTCHRRCRNQIAAHNAAAAIEQLKRLPRLSIPRAELYDNLRPIARLALCRRFHQDQVDEVAQKWYDLIIEELDRQPPPYSEVPPRGSTPPRRPVPTSSNTADADRDRLTEEVQRLRREMDELRSRLNQTLRPSGESTHRSETQGQGPSRQIPMPQRQVRPMRAIQSQTGRDSSEPPIESRGPRSHNEESNHREPAARDTEQEAMREQSRRAAEARRAEALRQERERAEREAAARLKAECAEARRLEALRQGKRERAEQQAEARRKAEQEKARQAASEASRLRREQEALRRAKETAQSWAGSWTRYNQDWERMRRVQTLNFDEDVRESIPWPVKGGKWLEVNDRNVSEFLDHAPDQVRDDPRAFLKFLNSQARIWHPDAVGREFPRLIGKENVMVLVTLVMQVINRKRDEIQQMLQEGN